MKQVNITFEDKEYEFLERIKKELGSNWHDFILDLARFRENHGKKK